MSEFQQAAEKAARRLDNIIDNSGEYLIDDATKIINKEFSDLQATHDKLVELAKYVKMRQEMETQPQDKNATYFDKLFAVKCALLSTLTDPQVQAAIGGKDETK